MSLRFEQLTGLELRAVKTEWKTSIGELAQSGDPELYFVLSWLERRRNGEPALTVDEVLKSTLADIKDIMEEDFTDLRDAADQDPTTAESGNA